MTSGASDTTARLFAAVKLPWTYRKVIAAIIAARRWTVLIIAPVLFDIQQRAPVDSNTSAFLSTGAFRVSVSERPTGTSILRRWGAHTTAPPYFGAPKFAMDISNLRQKEILFKLGAKPPLQLSCCACIFSLPHPFLYFCLAEAGNLTLMPPCSTINLACTLLTKSRVPKHTAKCHTRIAILPGQSGPTAEQYPKATSLDTFRNPVRISISVASNEQICASTSHAKPVSMSRQGRGHVITNAPNSNSQPVNAAHQALGTPWAAERLALRWQNIRSTLLPLPLSWQLQRQNIEIWTTLCTAVTRRGDRAARQTLYVGKRLPHLTLLHFSAGQQRLS